MNRRRFTLAVFTIATFALLAARAVADEATPAASAPDGQFVAADGKIAAADEKIAAADEKIAATGDVADAPPPDRRGVFTIVTENDLYAAHNSDRHYSNGIRIGWVSADDDLPDWARGLGDSLPIFADDARRRIGWAVGHNIYTPQDKQAETLIRNDRPYAAWAYVGMSLQGETISRLDTIEFDLGVVGPPAEGEAVQNHWHHLIGAKKTNGWHNQIRTEPGLMAVYERKWRNLLELPVGDLGIDAIPHVAAALGNIQTYAAAGITFRFGDNLKADFGPPRIRPALPGSSTFRPEDSFAWYLFVGAEGRAVARDIFLDGNNFRESPSVESKPLVADFQAGVAVLFQRVRLSYTQVIRTPEFEGQQRPDFFGSLSLSARF